MPYDGKKMIRFVVIRNVTLICRLVRNAHTKQNTISRRILEESFFTVMKKGSKHKHYHRKDSFGNKIG